MRVCVRVCVCVCERVFKWGLERANSFGTVREKYFKGDLCFSYFSIICVMFHCLRFILKLQ